MSTDTRTVLISLTFDATQCKDVTAENYDPAPDLANIMEFGADYYNLEDWKEIPAPAPTPKGRDARTLIDQEINTNLSTLIETLSKGFHEPVSAPEMSTLIESALDMQYAEPDYVTPAIDAGWRQEGHGWTRDAMDGEDESPECDDAQEACELDDLDPHEIEIFEFWAVSGWLGDKLQAMGEKVGEVAGLTVWGRTTTGQAIYMDHVIQSLVDRLNK